MDRMTSEVRIRKMERRDLQAVLDLINAEGWDYHISEMHRILDVDPENSVVACSGSEVIGSITAVVSGTRCVLGHVVVKDGWRNKGIGQEMMGRIEEMSDSKGIDTMEAYSVPPAVKFYQRRGYRSVEEIDTYDKKLDKKDTAGNGPMDKIRSLKKEHLDAICSLDKKVTGFDRRRTLAQFAADFPGKAKGLFEGDEMTAYFMFRVNPIMNDLGPWVMQRPDFDEGLAMIKSVLSEMEPGVRALGGVAMSNKVVREIFLSLDFIAVHKAYRMMRGKGEFEPFRPGMMTLGAFELG